MQPDRARFLLDFLRPHLKSEQATTKKILSAVPPEKGDYKPHPKSMSSLKLSRHIAATEMWFLDAVIDHVFKEDDLPMPPELKPGADIARWYDENFAQRLPRLEALSGEHLATPVSYIGLLNDPAVAYLSFGDNSGVERYFKPICQGDASPGCYGPSNWNCAQAARGLIVKRDNVFYRFYRVTKSSRGRTLRSAETRLSPRL